MIITERAPRFVEIKPLQGSELSVKVRIPDGLREVDEYGDIPKGHSTMSVPTPQDGDKRFTWDPGHLGEIFEAKAFFDACVDEGLVPYQVDNTSGQSTSVVMTEFDPHAGQVVFLPIVLVKAG
jgi:hypothetical protein